MEAEGRRCQWWRGGFGKVTRTRLRLRRVQESWDARGRATAGGDGGGRGLKNRGEGRGRQRIDEGEVQEGEGRQAVSSAGFWWSSVHESRTFRWSGEEGTKGKGEGGARALRRSRGAGSEGSKAQFGNSDEALGPAQRRPPVGVTAVEEMLQGKKRRGIGGCYCSLSLFFIYRVRCQWETERVNDRGVVANPVFGWTSVNWLLSFLLPLPLHLDIPTKSNMAHGHPPMPKVFLVRHGQTEWSLNGSAFPSPRRPTRRRPRS